MTLSLISLAGAMAALLLPLSRQGELPGWGRRAGQAGVVLADLIALSFYVDAEAAILVRLVAVVARRADRRRRPVTGPPHGAGVRHPATALRTRDVGS